MAGNGALVAAIPDGIALLERLGVISDVSLELPEDLSYDHYEALGMALADKHRRSAWLLGDWVNYGESRYGQKYHQAAELTGYAEDTLRQWASVANRVAPPQRVPGISHSIHADIAPLPPVQQREWLEKVAVNGWKREELRGNLRAVGLREERPRVTPALQPNLVEAARDLIRSARPSGVDFVVRRASFVDLRRALGDG